MKPRLLCLPEISPDLVINEQTTLIPKIPILSCSVSYESPESTEIKEIFQAPPGYTTCKVLESRRMTGENAPKQVFSFEIDFKGHPLQPGNSFDLICRNSDEDVNYLLEVLSLDPNKIIKVSGNFPFANVPISIRNLFKRFLDVNFFPKKSMLRHFSEFCSSSEESRILLYLSSKLGSSSYLNLASQCANISDFLYSFPSCKPSLESLLHHLPLLYPRAYSICSHDKDRVEFICTINSYSIPPPDPKVRIGVCSKFLLDEVVGKEDVSLYIKPRPPTSFQFALSDPITPIIMICAGAGVSPFIGFLRYAHSQGLQIADSWLFFGFRSTKYDFLFEEELERFCKQRILSNLRIATSREEGNPKYVQDALMHEVENIFPLLADRGAILYLCGDELTVIKAVNDTLLNMCISKTGSATQGKDLLDLWTKQRRILRDIWV